MTYKWLRHDNLSRLEWQCTDADGENVHFCTSNELRAPTYGDHDRWEVKQGSERITHYYRHNNPDIWCLHPVTPKHERRNDLLIQPGSHHLTFRANTAFFRISSRCCVLSSNPLRQEIHILCQRPIFDLAGFAAGIIYLPSPVPQSPQDDVKNIRDEAPYQSSAAASDSCFDRRRYNMHKPWPLYNVMMIRRGQWRGFRVALGTMHLTAFVQAKGS